MTTSLTDTIVPSFLSGKWLTPDNPTRITEVADPSTGEIVARVSAEGLDIAAAVNYARDIGRKNLQDRKSTRLNSSHTSKSRMPSSA